MLPTHLSDVVSRPVVAVVYAAINNDASGRTDVGARASSAAYSGKARRSTAGLAVATSDHRRRLTARCFCAIRLGSLSPSHAAGGRVSGMRDHPHCTKTTDGVAERSCRLTENFGDAFS